MKRLFYITIWMLAGSTLVLGQASDPDLKLTSVVMDGETKLQVANLTYGFVDLHIKKEGSDSVEDKIVVAPLDTVIFWELGTGSTDTLLEAFNKTYNINYFLGGNSKTISPDTDYLYSLPFGGGRKYSVSQAAKGKFSHSGPISQYAIDFQMEIGEKVYAAREGRVIKVIEEFKKAGGRELIWKANRIIILHDDGTTASYVHLDYQGVLVEEGDFVERGQHIGFSGNTGFSRGPHLHFVVRKEEDISIPVYFQGYEGVELKRRKKYRRPE